MVGDVPNTTENIAMLDLQGEVTELLDGLSTAIHRVLLSGQFIGGPEVHEFEKEVGEYLGVAHTVSVNSGTDALIIGLRAAGIGPGDEVITTPFTFFATVEAIAHVGARPVLVDIERDGFNIDTSAVEAAITPTTKAILPVHLFGEPVDMAPLLALALDHDLVVLEDCAQAFGGRYGSDPRPGAQVDARVGSTGDVAAFSFYPTKTLGAYGDGGLIATNDGSIAEHARSLRNHASSPHDRYVHHSIGYNSRLDEIQAAILRVKLPHVDRWTQSRQAAARRYDILLADLDAVRRPEPTPGHVYHQYTIRVPSGHRDAVRRGLADTGIASSQFYPPANKAWPSQFLERSGALPNANDAAATVISLPIHPRITTEQQERVVKVIKMVLG